MQTYRLITNQNYQQFVDQVNSWLKDGWTLHGDTFVVVSKSGAETFYQPLKRVS